MATISKYFLKSKKKKQGENSLGSSTNHRVICNSTDLSKTFDSYKRLVRDSNQSSNAFRVFCFFNSKQEIVVINAFKKKSNKTPLLQIEYALKLKSKYEKEQ